MTPIKFEIPEEDKERVADVVSYTIDTCTSFGFYPCISRGIKEAYRIGYESGYLLGLAKGKL